VSLRILSTAACERRGLARVSHVESTSGRTGAFNERGADSSSITSDCRKRCEILFSHYAAPTGLATRLSSEAVYELVCQAKDNDISQYLPNCYSRCIGFNPIHFITSIEFRNRTVRRPGGEGRRVTRRSLIKSVANKFTRAKRERVGQW